MAAHFMHANYTQSWDSRMGDEGSIFNYATAKTAPRVADLPPRGLRRPEDRIADTEVDLARDIFSDQPAAPGRRPGYRSQWD